MSGWMDASFRWRSDWTSNLFLYSCSHKCWKSSFTQICLVKGISFAVDMKHGHCFSFKPFKPFKKLKMSGKCTNLHSHRIGPTVQTGSPQKTSGLHHAVEWELCHMKANAPQYAGEAVGGRSPSLCIIWQTSVTVVGDFWWSLLFSLHKSAGIVLVASASLWIQQWTAVTSGATSSIPFTTPESFPTMAQAPSVLSPHTLSTVRVKVCQIQHTLTQLIFFGSDTLSA